jgi:hypothetical protein
MAGISRLDDILKKLEAVYAPVFVKEKEYPGNNPYVLNEINNLIMDGTLKQSDIKIDGVIVTYYDSEYLFNEGLDKIYEEICREMNEILHKRENRP